MSRRASGGTLAAFLILAAIVGFAGGAYLGTQSGDDDTANTPVASATDNGDEPNDETDTDTEGDEENNNDDDPPADSGGVSFSLAQTSASANEEISYSGRIESGEAGVRLQLQRSVDGGPWEDFPVSPRETNADGEFSGTIQSSRSGENSFRMVGINDDSLVSEEAVLTIN
ncbi:hypothetical protein [Phytoactinopolyspora mesophila]|uniref:Bacterial spore germination immunoglobulin-like domain-containing protein n=1 Tax=Phytoactinopolyspora mesophila TaxID=2650750 RepID=A0A7K3M674_9ACTN|nr:hypothetical protein [Phytoactinopolyspora mesophila]NDL58766.1 hypothetical protein [Phytoactinopolyspora mesophila]